MFGVAETPEFVAGRKQTCREHHAGKCELASPSFRRDDTGITKRPGPEHDVCRRIGSSCKREALTRQGRDKNRENNPMQSKVRPAALLLRCIRGRRKSAPI